MAAYLGSTWEFTAMRRLNSIGQAEATAVGHLNKYLFNN